MSTPKDKPQDIIQEQHARECNCSHTHHEHHEDACGCAHDHHESTCDCSHDHHESDCSCGHKHHEHSCSCGHDHHDHDDMLSCGCGHDHSHEDSSGKETLFITIGAVLFVVSLVLSKLSFNVFYILIIDLAAYLVLGGEIVISAFKNLIKGQVFDENFLMSIATIGAFAIKDYPEAVGVMLFYRIGELFEHKAVEKSRMQIMEAVDLRPETVNLLKNGEVVVIPAAQARVGDTIIVRPGDRVPLDGIVTEGESMLDTSAITGEPVPVRIGEGEAIISGYVNTSGQLVMKATKRLEDSMVTRILHSVENAAAGKPGIDRFITRFASVYTPVVVFLALAVAILPSLVSGNWHYWIYTAISFLVMSCPCALVLSVPLAFFCGIGKGSKYGILFKGGVSLEALTRVKAVVLDKTGTITEGNFKVQRIHAMPGFSEVELLKLAAQCEQFSSHPIALSIVKEARERALSFKNTITISEIAGRGIQARTEHGTILLGSRKLMDMNQVDMSGYQPVRHGSEALIAVNQVYAGQIQISDTIKKDAKTALERLKRIGIRTIMLTGDAAENADAVGREVGIDEVHAKLLPDEKLDQLRKTREKYGAVMFVGDGINDAPVLAGADVGAAMGSGADAAIEAADVVFMTSSMESVPKAIELSRKTYAIAKGNVIFALSIKILVMLLGLLGLANMWMAVFADTGVAMLCILNSVRLLFNKKE
ncbi:MAG: cadmium-translocating P-type ATPase [Blautia sp.]|nr:cadmium-translocating P-type ATPase [Blautia sp.]